MSRSGYVLDDGDHEGELELYRRAVLNAMRGKRGQVFFKALAAAMDEMPEKILIKHELISEEGECCTIGVVCKARNIDVSNVDIYDREEVGRLVNIAPALAAEIEYMNDEWSYNETPEARWIRIRKWVGDLILEEAA